MPLPGVHTEFMHKSPVVHELPSSQAPIAPLCVQPWSFVQESVVQGLPSSQTMPGPPMHRPPAQLSESVHGSPSVQEPAASVCVQPAATSQPFCVQGLPSSQLSAAPPKHPESLQVSPMVHRLPSSQAPVSALW